MSARYAIYFSPAPASPWWEFGSCWLGRDACSGDHLAQPVLPEIEPAALRSITEKPRHYGFHATLKAPFALGGGHTFAALQSRMDALASTLRPLALGPMQTVTLGDFVALVPAAPPDTLAHLAATCVTGLDDLRRPLTASDFERRQADGLDARGLELLQQFGYPHVLERFRLHFTLTGPVPPPVAQRVQLAVRDAVAHLNATAPLVLDRLCLFAESASGEAMRRIGDAELRA